MAENRLLLMESGKSAHRLYPDSIAFSNIKCVFNAISSAKNIEECSNRNDGKMIWQSLALFELAHAYTDWLYTRADTNWFACFVGATSELKEKRQALKKSLIKYQAFGPEKSFIHDLPAKDNICRVTNALFSPYSTASHTSSKEMTTVLLVGNKEARKLGEATFKAYFDHLQNASPSGDFPLMRRAHVERVTSEIAKHQPADAAFSLISSQLRQVLQNYSGMSADKGVVP
ncbi:MAG: hypothetical protein WCP20_16320 [Desulfuromonadales bacterium]